MESKERQKQKKPIKEEINKGLQKHFLTQPSSWQVQVLQNNTSGNVWGNRRKKIGGGASAVLN